jgi:hypothetical protein
MWPRLFDKWHVFWQSGMNKSDLAWKFGKWLVSCTEGMSLIIKSRSYKIFTFFGQLFLAEMTNE